MNHELTRSAHPTLTVREAASLMKVTPATIYAWVRADELPYLRLGGRIRIPTAKMAALLGITPHDLVDSLK
jgi:excisionase family DNA binding protein